MTVLNNWAQVAKLICSKFRISMTMVHSISILGKCDRIYFLRNKNFKNPSTYVASILSKNAIFSQNKWQSPGGHNNENDVQTLQTEIKYLFKRKHKFVTSSNHVHVKSCINSC